MIIIFNKKIGNIHYTLFSKPVICSTYEIQLKNIEIGCKKKELY